MPDGSGLTSITHTKTGKRAAAKILVVDDEQDLVRLVRYNLAQEGFQVFHAYLAQEALDIVDEEHPDVVVLDWMLPDRSGIDVCRLIKERTATYVQQSGAQPVRVIMLTARAAQQDRITGLEAGSDDYLTKPFSPRELVLRVKALLNRNHKWYDHQTIPQLKVGPIAIDPAAHQAKVNNEVLELTPIEFKILLTLALHPNVVKTREQLLMEVWEQAATEVLDRTVDAHVKRLRAKLGPVAREQLETVRGIGYRLNQTAATL
jgi:two-component system, OmpR family, phosphate regulon response regulator PhoB